MKFKKLLVFLAVLLFAAGGTMGCGNVDKIERVQDTRRLTPEQFSEYNLCGTDAIGRRIDPVDGPKAGEKLYVGVFYSVWLGGHAYMQKGNYNIQYLLDTEDGKAQLYNTAGTPESPIDEFHFWGEPLYGYYSMSDPWIVTRHIELLTAAGLDYLCIDATNSVLYDDATKNLLDTLLVFNEQGFKVPKVMFYTNSHSGTTATNIYNKFYVTQKYNEVWFAPNDKPMLIGITENNKRASDQTKYYPGYSNFLTEQVQAFFDIRESQWPNGNYNEEGFPWMTWSYPQLNHKGTVSVPVAQHSHSRISASYMDPESHRGYNNLTRKVEGDWREGLSFQNMWDQVFRSPDPVNNVLVCSFNEWMAIKQVNGDGEVHFVDVFNNEYSRDIEMMVGGYGDNYYMQLAQNTRKFKYNEPKHYAYQQMTIDLASDTHWNMVKAHYRDFSGDARLRDFTNASNTGKYTDNSNRNDITDIRVAHDSEKLYFYVECKEDITAYNGTDVNWMNLFIKAGEPDKSFSGYNFVINRSPETGKTSIERSKGGYDWEKVGDADYVLSGKTIRFAIPLSSLGLSQDNCAIEFKVSDNVTKYDDIMNYYVTGDSAPIGRLSYSYGW